MMMKNMMRSITRTFSTASKLIPYSKSKDNIIVNGMKDFRSLLNSPSSMRCDNLVIKNMGDIYSYSEHAPLYCDNLFMIDCNKNFVYYWVERFCVNRNVILFSHPCDPYVMHYLMREQLNIYLSERYYRYARWCGSYKNMVIVDSKTESKIIKYFEKN